MSQSSLYDEDILLWSEQHAEIIRKLGQTRRDLPNELDVENVAEEIESVGRSELAVVESQLQNILVHLMKIATQPGSAAVRHWRAAVRHWRVEIAGFHAEVLRRYVPSMRQRIDFGKLWAFARGLVLLAADQPRIIESILPERPPLDIGDLLLERIDSLALAQRIRAAGEQGVHR